METDLGTSLRRQQNIVIALSNDIIESLDALLDLTKDHGIQTTGIDNSNDIVQQIKIQIGTSRVETLRYDEVYQYLNQCNFAKESLRVQLRHIAHLLKTEPGQDSTAQHKQHPFDELSARIENISTEFNNLYSAIDTMSNIILAADSNFTRDMADVHAK